MHRTIGLIETSDNADREKWNSEEFHELRTWFLHEGYDICEGQYLHTSIHGSTPEQRASDIHRFFQDPEIDIVWPIGGGWCANELLPHLDFDLIATHRKPFIGFSDITVLQNAFYHRSGLVSFSGPNFGLLRHRWYGHDQMITQITSVLNGVCDFEFMSVKKYVDYWEISEHNAQGLVHDSGMHILRPGVANGVLIGGNLSSLCLLIGTPYMPSFEGTIIVLEECGELGIGDIRRLLVQLRQTQDFSGVQALVFGKLNKVSYRDVELAWHRTIMEIFGDLDIPILADGPFGHIYPFQIFPIGGACHIDTSHDQYRVCANL